MSGVIIAMPVSGLLITFKDDAALAEEAMAALQSRPELTLGQRQAHWLPVAAEAREVAAGCQLHDWIAALPGVAFVDVVSVHFDEEKE